MSCCCRATNDHCSNYEDSFTWPGTGCENCGHSKGCHFHPLMARSERNTGPVRDVRLDRETR